MSNDEIAARLWHYPDPPKPGTYTEVSWEERENRVKAFLDAADEATELLMWRQLVINHPYWPRNLLELNRMERVMKAKETK